MMNTMHDYKLCFCRDGSAWFTTAPVDGIKFTVDGEPYSYAELIAWQPDCDKDPYLLKKVQFDGGNVEDFGRFLECNYASSERFNKGEFPWLRTKLKGGYRFIFSGITLANFTLEIEAAKGTIYLRPSDYIGFVQAEEMKKDNSTVQGHIDEMNVVHEKVFTGKNLRRERPKKSK